MTIAVLSEKGPVVISATIRERQGLQRGDRFEVEVKAEGIVFRPLPHSPLTRLRGAFKGQDSLTDELLRDHQAERQSNHR